MKKSIFLTFVLSASAFAISSHAAPNVENGKTLYDAKCAKCHGKTGGGDGKSAKALNTTPTKFNDPTTFTDKKKLEITPDERMAKAIKEGGEAVKQSKEMDKFPSYSDQDIQDILAYIKTFAK